jgi:Fe-S-cluster containining protein
VTTPEHQFAQQWLAAARDEAIALELEAVYQVVADQVEARRPLCVASGRCCHFEQHGHRLYVTGLEAAYTLTRLGRGVTAAEIGAARARGDCPLLVDELCTAHTIKPLGCRVYYCDPTAQEWQKELSERALEMIRRLHERRGIEYRYGEWRGMLELFAAPASGR